MFPWGKHFDVAQCACSVYIIVDVLRILKEMACYARPAINAKSAVDFIVRSKERKLDRHRANRTRREQNCVVCTKTEINCGIPNYLAIVVHWINVCICIGRPKLSISLSFSQTPTHNQQNGISIVVPFCLLQPAILNYIETNEPDSVTKDERKRGKPNEYGRMNSHNQ